MIDKRDLFFLDLVLFHLKYWYGLDHHNLNFVTMHSSDAVTRVLRKYISYPNYKQAGTQFFRYTILINGEAIVNLLFWIFWRRHKYLIYEKIYIYFIHAVYKAKSFNWNNPCFCSQFIVTSSARVIDYLPIWFQDTWLIYPSSKLLLLIH